MRLDPKRLADFLAQGQDLRSRLAEKPLPIEDHNAWVDRITTYLSQQGAEDYIARLDDFSGMTFFGDGSERSKISNSITGRCQRLHEFIAETRQQPATDADQQDHSEPPSFVKNLMWLLRKDTWVKHPISAAVALIIMASAVAVGTTQLIISSEEELPVETSETQELNELLGSCTAGDAEACNSAGVRVGDGKGAPVDFARSARLYETACQLGSSRGCRNAARRYKYGRGVNQDYQRALELYELSCTPQYARGCAELEEFRAYLDDAAR